VRVEIQDARATDAEALTEIRVQSKGHWGYSAGTLEAWRPAMRMTPEYIRANRVRTIHADGALVGFHALKGGATPELDHLWLLPAVIGQGLGRVALADSLRCAAELGYAALRIISDVDAQGFYLHFGAVRVGEFFSPVQGRMLPVLELQLPPGLTLRPPRHPPGDPCR